MHACMRRLQGYANQEEYMTKIYTRLRQVARPISFLLRTREEAQREAKERNSVWRSKLNQRTLATLQLETRFHPCVKPAAASYSYVQEQDAGCSVSGPRLPRSAPAGASPSAWTPSPRTPTPRRPGSAARASRRRRTAPPGTAPRRRREGRRRRALHGGP